MFLKSSTGQSDGYDTNKHTGTNNCKQHCIKDSVHNNLSTLLSLQVRVFTYLIGREMTFAENVKWIACNNKGKNQIRITHEHEGQKN